MRLGTVFGVCRASQSQTDDPSRRKRRQRNGARWTGARQIVIGQLFGFSAIELFWWSVLHLKRPIFGHLGAFEFGGSVWLSGGRGGKGGSLYGTTAVNEVNLEAILMKLRIVGMKNTIVEE